MINWFYKCHLNLNRQDKEVESEWRNIGWASSNIESGLCLAFDSGGPDSGSILGPDDSMLRRIGEHGNTSTSPTSDSDRHMRHIRRLKWLVQSDTRIDSEPTRLEELENIRLNSKRKEEVCSWTVKNRTPNYNSRAFPE